MWDVPAGSGVTLDGPNGRSGTMAGFDDIADKGKDAMKDEGASDKALDGAEGAADKATGGKHSEQVDSARDKADDKLGD